MENITVKAEFLFEFNSKKEWIDRLHHLIPKDKENYFFPKEKRVGEQRICLDKNGGLLTGSLDFILAEKLELYPCKVYRLQSISHL